MYEYKYVNCGHSGVFRARVYHLSCISMPIMSFACFAIALDYCAIHQLSIQQRFQSYLLYGNERRTNYAHTHTITAKYRKYVEPSANHVDVFALIQNFDALRSIHSGIFNVDSKRERS